jgi:beta-N-acetylhexosaminidase
VIFGCSGLSLTDEEAGFFAAADPYGFILFARNVESPEQVRRLVGQLRNSVGRHAPVLIDQEGGRVQRLKPLNWRNCPPMADFGRMAARDLPLARRAAALNARLIAGELADLGIDVDCAPVLDLPAAGADAVIGDRAFASDPMLAADLGRAVMEGFLDGGVTPVVKHIPGHGRATVDSHKALPRVDADRHTLETSDFVPFRALRDAPWAMTAHVVYSAFDQRRPATLSPIVIEQVIRGFIGCDGVLISDDLSMQALTGDFGERARAGLAAGCDLLLHCNGDIKEMRQVAAGVRPLDEAAELRLARADVRKRRLPPPPDGQKILDGWMMELAS